MCSHQPSSIFSSRFCSTMLSGTSTMESSSTPEVTAASTTWPASVQRPRCEKNTRILEVGESFTYLGSTISSNLSLDVELNTRIGKAPSAMARLAKRVWDNSMLTTNTKMKVYQACVLSTRLYGSEAWTLYSRQEHRLNAFHLRCLRRLLGITWQERVPNSAVLAQAKRPSMAER